MWTGGGPTEFESWVRAQQAAQVNVHDLAGSERYKKFVGAYPPLKPMMSPLTTWKRGIAFARLKLLYPLSPDGYDMAMFCAKFGKHDMHYGEVLFRRQDVDPEYICYASTYESRDGEYRSRMVRWAKFSPVYEKFLDTMAPFEAAILKLVDAGELQLYTRMHPPQAERAQVDQLRLPIMALAACIISDLYYYVQGIMMEHVVSAYRSFLDKISTDFPELRAVSEKNNAHSRPSEPIFDGPVMPLQCGGHLAGGGPLRCGQKLVPMFASEVLDPYDLSAGAWRELAVATAVSDLVVNHVTPSFPLHGQWTYVEGTDAGMYETTAMEERFVRSSAVGPALKALRVSRANLSHPVVSPNFHTESLRGRIYDDLDYARSTLQISNISMLHVMEHVGGTLRNAANLVRNHKTYRNPIELFESPDCSARVLFEYAYAAYCMHTRVGAAHCDLHGNNLTLTHWSADSMWMSHPPSDPPKMHSFYELPIISYVIGTRGEADTFCFPSTGLGGYIIDFSRAILGPAFNFKRAGGPAARDAAGGARFFRGQVNRAMRTLFRHAPDFVRDNESEIRGAAIADFGSVFAALCASDFIMIGASFADVLEAAVSEPGDFRKFTTNPECVARARELERAGRTALIEALHAIVHRARPKPDVLPPAAPVPAGASIISKVFAEWKYSARDREKMDKSTLTEIYRSDLPLKYSGSDYEKFPPWARVDEIDRHLAGARIEKEIGREVDPFFESLRFDPRLDIAAELARADLAREDGAPPPAGSSWIDE